eukprot:495525-Alexandrium_andersonii.AAC.1
MASAESAAFDRILQSRSPRSPQRPADVITSGQLHSLRVPFCAAREVSLLSPEAVHGAALAFQSKEDDSTHLRTHGPLGIRLADLCQMLCPQGATNMLEDMCQTSPARHFRHAHSTLL